MARACVARLGSMKMATIDSWWTQNREGIIGVSEEEKEDWRVKK